MATYLPHYKVTANGVFAGAGGALEIFSYGFQFGIPDAFTDVLAPLAPGVANAVDSAVVAFHQRAATKIGTSAYLEMVKIAPIKSDGKYAGPPIEFPHTGIGGGGGSAVIHPFQVACGVSFEGPPAVRRRRGRMYLPLPAIAVQAATGGMSTADADAVLGSVETLVSAVNTAIAPNEMTFAIAAQTSTVDPAGRPAVNARVETLKVGLILDTQRRRRNDLAEAYRTVALVP